MRQRRGLHDSDGGEPVSQPHLRWWRHPAPKTVGQCKGGDYVVAEGRVARVAWIGHQRSAVTPYRVVVTWGVPGLSIARRRFVEFWENDRPVRALALMP